MVVVVVVVVDSGKQNNTSVNSYKTEKIARLQLGCCCGCGRGGGRRCRFW